MPIHDESRLGVVISKIKDGFVKKKNHSSVKVEGKV
jgi:hypothetical protein